MSSLHKIRDYSIVFRSGQRVVLVTFNVDFGLRYTIAIVKRVVDWTPKSVADVACTTLEGSRFGVLCLWAALDACDIKISVSTSTAISLHLICGSLTTRSGLPICLSCKILEG
ncbi:unnamed protein product [Hermetia illucens]|uniref:Uncharacterized protein n=1 Tax=Hermetia illucens TaxID=343691 RepID=A0A7R8V061_HERIL|nr:unnamed protein product [Hermetia illucens]